MYYALLIRTDPDEMLRQPPETFSEIAGRVESFDAQLNAEGRNAGSVRLGADGARVVRLRGGKPFVTDGPFAESKEQLGGVYLIEADDIEHATETATELVMALGHIEIRPVVGIDLREPLVIRPNAR